MNTPKLSTLEKVGFGTGDMAVNVVWSSMALIITFFYTDVFGLHPADIALLLILPRLIDAFADLFMGVITDRHTTRWGRYRPYLLLMSVPFGLSVMCVFTTPDLPYAGKLAWAYGAYIVMMLCFTAVTIPYISLIGVLTEDPQERLSANGYRLFFAKVAAFMVTIIVPLLASRWGQGHIARGYQVAMALMAGMATLLFLFCFFTTTERVKHTVRPIPLLEQMRHLMKNDQWLILGAVCVIGTIGYTIRGAVAAYYAKYYLGGDAALLSEFLTTGVVASILAMVASTWITKRFCKIKLFRWSQLVVGVLSALLYFTVKPGDVVPAFILYFLVCFVVDLHAPVFWSAIAEAVDYGEHKTGRRVAGLAFGGISFFQKTGMSLAGGTVGVLLTYYHYVPDHAQSAFTLNGIALMLSIIPGVFHVLMGLLMFRYRITDDYYNTMRRTHPVDRDRSAAEPAPSSP